jgi:hypothetical protein
MDNEKWFTRKEVASLLGCSADTVKRREKDVLHGHTRRAEGGIEVEISLSGLISSGLYDPTGEEAPELTIRRTDAELQLGKVLSVEWRAGIPSLSMSAEAFRGRTISSKRFGRVYAFKGVNPLDYGQVYDYRFDLAEMRDPVAEVITDGGWTFRPVTSKRKLAG